MRSTTHRHDRSRRALLKQACALGLGVGLAAALPRGAHAAPLRLEVVGVGATRIPVGLAAFEGEPAAAAEIDQVLLQDLQRSAVLRPALRAAQLPAPDAASAWLRGQVMQQPDGQLQLQWSLWDTLRAQALHTQQVLGSPRDLRLMAHRVADSVEALLTGLRGVNATRIAYVVQQGQKHLLKIADSDGANHRVALTSLQSLISPAWSPDGRELAYVSFEAGQAQVWVQTLQTGSRRVLAAFRGSNSAPAWSPDGQRLALALSRDGLTQLFVMPREGGTPQRISHSSAIDTEPAWSPDGRHLYFTSDRGGTPQIYRTALDGGGTERITFDSHSVSPSLSPDGQHLAYVSRQEGAFRLVLKDLGSGSLRVLTNSDDDERPSFAPNGRLIAYATREAGRDHLMTTSLDGSVRARLLSTGLDVREPAWGPWLPDADTPGTASTAGEPAA